MSNNLKKKRKSGYIDKQHLSTSSLYLLFPLFLIVTVLPLIVSMHSYSSGLGSYDWYPAEDTAFDFFLYYKQWFFVIVAGLCFILLIFKAITNKNFVKIRFAFYPLFGYAFLALISTLFSEHRIFGFSGVFEQFENIFCLLGYVLVAYYVFLVLQSEYEIKLIINALAIGALIIGLIGTFQAFGFDFFNTSFGKSLIVEKGIDPTSLNMAFENGRTYATLYNPNYVGVYASMIIPLFAVLLFFQLKAYEYVLYGSVIITQVISMFGAQSKTGMVSIAITILLAIVLLRKVLLRKWFIIVPILASAIIGFVVINAIQDNAYINAIKSAFINRTTTQPYLSEITTSDEYIKVTYQGNTFYVTQNSDKSLILFDSEYKQIETHSIDVYEGGYSLQIADERFSTITPMIFTDNIAEFGLLIDDIAWLFKFDKETNQYLYLNQYGKYCSIKNAPSMLFDGKENFATGRGYIWSRTIPLLKDHIILGSGADTFVFEFPHYDYVNLSNYGFGTQLMTKPHSLYLQMGVQTGVISLVCFVGFYIIYFFQSVILYIRKKEFTFLDACGIAILLSTFSYMISGFTNDSNISVAPIFWVLVGAGFVTNKLSVSNHN